MGSLSSAALQATMAAEPSSGDDKNDDTCTTSSNSLLLRSLDAWESEVKALPYMRSAPNLSHYEHMPEPVIQAYQLLTHGAELLQATATKYTLYMQATTKEEEDDDAKSKTTELFHTEFQRAAESILVACLTLHDDSVGCARSTRTHVRTATRNLLAVTKRLLLAPPSAVETGIVWDACAFVIEQRLPQGNRNAMRRDLFLYRVECQETVEEFQTMIDVSAESTTGTTTAVVTEDDDDDDNEEALFHGDFRYATVAERSVAQVCVYLLRCSRGALNVALQAMEVAAVKNEDDADVDHHNNTLLFRWCCQLHDRARPVGEGVTEVGSLLYPPLDLAALQIEVERQVQAIQDTLQWVLGTTSNNNGSDDSSSVENYHPTTVPAETMTLASTVEEAVRTRTQEFQAAVAELRHSGGQ